MQNGSYKRMTTSSSTLATAMTAEVREVTTTTTTVTTDHSSSQQQQQQQVGVVSSGPWGTKVVEDLGNGRYQETTTYYTTSLPGEDAKDITNPNHRIDG